MPSLLIAVAVHLTRLRRRLTDQLTGPRARRGPRGEDGYGVAEWAVLAAILVAAALFVGTVLASKISDKMQQLDLG